MSDITDEMIRAGAAAMWGSPERDAMKISRMVLGAALAGRVVVDLPNPDGEDADGPYWMGSRSAIQADVEHGVPIVRTEYEDYEADAAEADALARLAAVREARRLATEQSSGVAGGGVR
jgi:hypothetical protein